MANSLRIVDTRGEWAGDRKELALASRAQAEPAATPGPATPAAPIEKYFSESSDL